jgi:hypothetical protein
MVPERLVIALNLANHAVTQYLGFNFNSMVECDGRFFGFNEDGIFELESGDVDAVSESEVAPIDSSVTFAPVNDVRIGRKRVRKCVLTGEFEDAIAVGVAVSGQEPRFSYNSKGTEDRSFTFPREGMTGSSLQVTVSNVGGSFFDLQGVDVFLTQQHEDGRR